MEAEAALGFEEDADEELDGLDATRPDAKADRLGALAMMFVLSNAPRSSSTIFADSSSSSSSSSSPPLDFFADDEDPLPSLDLRLSEMNLEKIVLSNM